MGFTEKVGGDMEKRLTPTPDGRLHERLQSMATISILDLEVSLGHARRIAQLVDQWEAWQD